MLIAYTGADSLHQMTSSPAVFPKNQQWKVHLTLHLQGPCKLRFTHHFKSRHPLGIGLLQQSAPELVLLCGVHEHQLAIVGG